MLQFLVWYSLLNNCNSLSTLACLRRILALNSGLGRDSVVICFIGPEHDYTISCSICGKHGQYCKPSGFALPSMSLENVQ